MFKPVISFETKTSIFVSYTQDLAMIFVGDANIESNSYTFAIFKGKVKILSYN